MLQAHLKTTRVFFKYFDQKPRNIFKERLQIFFKTVLFKMLGAHGILYKADPDPDPGLQKKRTPDL